MLTIKSFVFNAFSENTYIIFDETKEAVIIDPGCYEKKEFLELDDFISDQGLQIKYLLNTHCHIDHVLGNDHIKEKYKAPLLIHPIEEQVLKSVKSYAPNYGFPLYKEVIADKFLAEGDHITFGKTSLEILFVPGHSPGHLAFYDKKSGNIFSGDVLFERSIGRTDLPGGNLATLLQSIRQKLFLLPDEVIVYSGHGSPTTIGIEKTSNPYCALQPSL